MISQSTAPVPNPHRLLAPWLFIALGSVMRVIWPLDFEWKLDEKWMFEEALRIADGRSHWPWVGMISGAGGARNPGASMWPFAVFAHVTQDPATMTLFVMLLNAVALWGMALWVHEAWNEGDRPLGMWGVALFAVSPLPVLFSRKIWAQDLLPVLLVPWLWGHTRRKNFAGAFAWGAVGALLGQVHMSGFFAAASLVLATLILDRKSTRWLGWFAGSCLASLPLVPWLLFMLSPAGAVASPYVLSARFIAAVFANAWGVGLRYSLRDHFVPYLHGPEVFGIPTQLSGAAHLLLGVLAIACAVLTIRTWRTLRLSRELSVHALSIGLCGLMLLVLGIKIYPHYMIVFSPLLHVLAVWVLAQRRPFVWAACSLQFFVTASFLWFIHVNGGAPRGDYGTAYRTQSPAQRALGTQ